MLDSSSVLYLAQIDIDQAAVVLKTAIYEYSHLCNLCNLEFLFWLFRLKWKWGNLFDVRATDKCGNLSLSRVKFLDKKVAGEVFVSSTFDPRDPEYLLVQPDSNVDLLFS